jgi:hypothetical protein
MDITVEELPNSKPIQSPQATARTEPIAHLSLAARFNIDTPNKQEEGKLAEIWAYAAGVAKSSEIPDIMWEVIHLEGVLGAPKLGEARIDRLYRYAKLKRQEIEIQEQLKNVSNSNRI